MAHSRTAALVLSFAILAAASSPALGQQVTNVTTGQMHATIQEAIDSASAGDVIELTAGTFLGLGNTNVDYGGKDVTVRGATGDPADVVIDCLNTAETRGFTFTSGETRAAVLADLTIANGNMSTGPGGGIFIDEASPTIRNCAFVGNHTAVWGGGIFHDHGEALVVGCTFTNNSGVQDGGGMFNGFGHSSVVDCTFVGNSARNGGGLIMNAGGTEVTGCTFVRNTAAFNSGGLHIGILAVPVKDCAFLGNTAGLRAGGLFTGAGTFDVVNCAFVGNTSLRFGGGFFNSTARPTLVNCSFIANFAQEAGGAVYNDFQSTVVLNSILWNDAPAEVALNTGSVAIEYSNVLGGYPGTGNLSADPFFARAPSPGTDGAWGTDDDDYGDLRLTKPSPCIDAASNAAVPPGVTADLDGANRFVDDPTRNDTGDAGTRGPPVVDMGAYEHRLEEPRRRGGLRGNVRVP